ncbi:hypothetical protein Ancab_005347 [Ancistrocladus abbreviatus]
MFFDVAIGNGKSYRAVILINGDNQFWTAKIACHDCRDPLLAEAMACAEAVELARALEALASDLFCNRRRTLVRLVAKPLQLLLADPFNFAAHELGKWASRCDVGTQ